MDDDSSSNFITILKVVLKIKIINWKLKFVTHYDIDYITWHILFEIETRLTWGECMDILYKSNKSYLVLRT